MVKSVGFACLMTSLTTACGFVSLYFARIRTISRFGLNMAIAIMTTYVVSLLAMTVVLSTIKRVPESRRRHARTSGLSSIVDVLARLVVRRWRLVLAGCVPVMAVLAFGFSHLYVETHAVAELPERSPTKQNIKAMNNLAGFIGFEVSVNASDGSTVIDPETLRKVDALARYLREQPETLRTWSVVDYLKTMNQAAHEGRNEAYAVPASAAAADQFLLLYGFSPEGLQEMNGLISQDRKWLRVVSRVYDVGAKPYLRLRDRVETLGRSLFPDGNVEIRVTSEMCLLHVAMNNMVRDLMRSMAWAFGLVAVLMAFSLRSVRLGLVAFLPNIIPLLATLGFMGLTGIALRVGTMVVFSLGLGIAVDDTIHYLLRYRRERQEASDYGEGVLRTHRRVGRPMVLTSLILMAGFLAIGLATFRSIWQMGVLCSFTMAVALLADLLITPLLLRFVERPAGALSPAGGDLLPAFNAKQTESQV
jgi:predicted RND superfamily exporter protein